jgi:hypothetical protein
LGEGWWIASDGKWYPAESHPDAYLKRFSAPDDSAPELSVPAGTMPEQGMPEASVPAAVMAEPRIAEPDMAPPRTAEPDMAAANRPNGSVPEADMPPGPGWWKASDGNWYAPELHPGAAEPIEVPRPGRSAVTRSAGASAPGGVQAAATRMTDGAAASPGPGRAASPPAPNDLDFDPMLDFDTLFGIDDSPSSPAASASSSGASAFSLAASAPETRTPAASEGPRLSESGASASRPPDWLPKAVAAAQRPVGLRIDHGSFNAAGGSSDHRATADPVPGENTDRRPINPGSAAASSGPGSTTREDLPGPRSVPQPRRGHTRKDDDFDTLVEALSPTARPPSANQPRQRMRVSEVSRGSWTTTGGPASAVPHQSPQEADFFVLKPSHKKQKPVHTKPRPKLSGLVFLLVLLLVLAAVAATLIYLH